MDDDINNPSDKPSFFDFANEARSWPPQDDYQIENEKSKNEQKDEIIDNLYTNSDLSRSVFEELIESQIQNQEEPESPEIEIENSIEEIVDFEKSDETNELNFESSNIEPSFKQSETVEYLDHSFHNEFDKPAVNNPEKTESIFFRSNQENSEDNLVQSRPFKTYYSNDYQEIQTAEATVKDPLAQVNKNIILLALIVIIFVFYFLISNVFNRKFEPKTRRQHRSSSKKLPAESSLLKEELPLWDLTEQREFSADKDSQLASYLYKNSGRSNPFATPDSVLADLKRAVEQAIIAKEEPHTYKRKAYRATLLGVLHSSVSTVALISFQEASFDVVENTSKDKIIKLAIKSMEKSKHDSLEVSEGSSLGPWIITKIESPKDSFSDAKVYLQHAEQVRILRMGKAEELGIFDEAGHIDNLDSADPRKIIFQD